MSIDRSDRTVHLNLSLIDRNLTARGLPRSKFQMECLAWEEFQGSHDLQDLNTQRMDF